MEIFQKKVVIKRKPRGFHLITSEVEEDIPDLRSIKAGIAHIHIMHTSASISLNENADPTVRTDMESFFTRMVPENDLSLYEHTMEGPDDMTSHIKNTVIGSSITLPITNGKFNVGTWQGIYLCEHRNSASNRKLLVTIMGK